MDADYLYVDTTGSYCELCGRPYTYVGDVPKGGFPKGMEPWCTCGVLNNNPAHSWTHCPHCGKELK